MFFCVFKKIKEGWDSAEWLKKAVVQMEYQEDKGSFCTLFNIRTEGIHSVMFLFVLFSRKDYEGHTHDGCCTMYSATSKRNAEETDKVPPSTIAISK